MAAELGIPNTAEIAPAKAMIDRCLKEEQLCLELQNAQGNGGMLMFSTGQGLISFLSSFLLLPVNNIKY